jgi:MFS family permease
LTNLIPYLGLANTIGPIVCGFVCDRAFLFKYGKDRARNRLWFYIWSLIIIGVATAFVFVMVNQFTNYCFIFGIFISPFVCLTSVILVDLVGMDRLTNAFGLLLFVQWVAVLIVPRLLSKFMYKTVNARLMDNSKCQ